MESKLQFDFHFLCSESDEDTKPKCQTLPKVPDLNAVEKCTNFLSLKATKAFVVVCTLGRVSVHGVKSLGSHFACLCWGFEFYEVKKIKYY